MENIIKKKLINIKNYCPELDENYIKYLKYLSTYLDDNRITTSMGLLISALVAKRDLVIGYNRCTGKINRGLYNFSNVDLQNYIYWLPGVIEKIVDEKFYKNFLIDYSSLLCRENVKKRK